MTALSMAQQLVSCKFEKCESGCDVIFGTGCSLTCYYVCEDGKTRSSSHPNMHYACQGVSGMFNNKPDCRKVYEETRREIEEKNKRQAENEKSYARQQGENCDMEQAYRMSGCLEMVGQFYIDKVNDFLVNGQKTPLIDKIDFYSGRDTINTYNGCFDIFSYKDIAKGKGLEISLAEAGTRSCMVFGKDHSSCKKGMKILLKTSLKNGKQDSVADECDFWNDCEKIDGPVLESASWEIPGKTNCDAMLKEKMEGKALDIRKKFK